MWNSQSASLNNGHTVRIAIKKGDAAASYAKVIQAWREDVTFRNFFIDLLMASPYSAFRWETPPVSTKTVNRPFEFVLINSPSLARSPDRQTFAQHFQSRQSIVTFPNLGKDAVLVVPCPSDSSVDYSHLSVFIRKASRTQQQELWIAVGEAMANRLGTQPVWLSTAGGGVAWLHIRLDDYPKYYHHQPYRAYS